MDSIHLSQQSVMLQISRVVYDEYISCQYNYIASIISSFLNRTQKCHPRFHYRVEGNLYMVTNVDLWRLEKRVICAIRI